MLTNTLDCSFRHTVHVVSSQTVVADYLALLILRDAGGLPAIIPITVTLKTFFLTTTGYNVRRHHNMSNSNINLVDMHC